MKMNINFLILVFLIGFASCDENRNEDIKTETKFSDGIALSSFKVWGNCEMCKKTIESSLNVQGVNYANWNPETKGITVSYDTSLISLDQIQKNIALAGYDNESYKGNDSTYQNLPGCCQYHRK